MKALSVSLLALFLGVFGFFYLYQDKPVDLPPVEYVSFESFNPVGKIPVLGTGSMQPWIPASDNPTDIVAFVDAMSLPLAEVKIGHVVLFFRGNYLIIHRVVARSIDGNLVVAGINNKRSDEFLTEDNYAGIIAIKVYVDERYK